MAQGEGYRASTGESRLVALLLETSPEPMALLDTASCRLLAVNDPLLTCTGYQREELLATPNLLALAPRAPAWVRRRVGASGQEVEHDRRVLSCKDGRRLTVETRSYPCSGEDPAIRLLIGAVLPAVPPGREPTADGGVPRLVEPELAHDFRNLCTMVLASAETLRRSLGPGDPRLEDVDIIAHAAGLAAELSGVLMREGAPPRTAPLPVDWNELLGRIHPTLARAVGPGIRVTVAPAPGLGLVSADPGALELMLLNLALNAREAMPDGGDLQITTTNLPPTPTHPAGRVLLAVVDTGLGMDPAVQARVFEPYFSTKAEGRGTGLGLPSVAAVVRRAGGEIEVASQPGSGSRFELRFPRADRSEPEPPETEAPTRPPVLVVDDEASLRRLFERLLKRAGFGVHTLASAGEALALDPLDLARYHAVIIDVGLPDLDGADLAARLRERAPGVRLILTSGRPLTGCEQVPCDYLPKPFDPATLFALLGPATSSPAPDSDR